MGKFGDGFMFGILVGMGIMLLVSGILLIEEGINKPIASQDALEYCLDRGYETYEDYERVIFSREALGVKCEVATRNYDIEGEGIIAVGD